MSIKNKLEQGKQAWLSVFIMFQELGIPVNEPLSQVGGMTFSQFNERTTYLLEALLSLKFVTEDRQYLLPQTALSEAESFVDELCKLPELVTQLSQIRDEQGGVKNFIPANCQLNANSGNGYDISQYFVRILSRSTAVLERIATLPPVYTDAIETLRNRATSFEEAGIRIGERERDAKKVVALLEETASEAKTVLETIEGQNKTAAELSQSLSQSVTTAASQLGEVQNKVTLIKETTTDATTLASEVQNYASKFKTFDTQLETRIQTLQSSDKQTEQFLKKNQDRENQIDGLITKADQMIKGATVAGLSKSFADRASKYGWQCFGARIGFYCSILLLAISAIPLALYIFPIPTEITNFEWTKMFSSEGKLTLGGVLGRLVVLAPAVWLTSFNSKRFSELFFLYQQYNHKAAVAQSIDGFKREAPSYQEDICAAMFLELSENPSALLKKQKGGSPAPMNPILDKIVDLTLKRVGKKAVGE